MNTIWSDYVQTTRELYESRAIRFTDENRALWLDALGLCEGSEYPSDFRVLEVGCAGGLFCHRLAAYFPKMSITGLDRDDNHIKFARDMNERLGLDCRFTVGDATALPFDEGSFDLVFSHTVSEHIPPEHFYPEQYRVLKPGGRIVVLSSRPRLAVKDVTQNEMSDEERSLTERLWSSVSSFEGEEEIGKYSTDEHEHPKILEKYGFREIGLKLFCVNEYAPDNADIPPESARRQIESHRVGSLAPIEKAVRLAPNALTTGELARLRELINARYDERLAKYERGERVWDFATAAILAASGIKVTSKNSRHASSSAVPNCLNGSLT